MASKTSTAPMKVGILSVGDMGVGIARLLIAHGIAVATNCQGRSEATIERARQAKVEILVSDLELVQQCTLVLSVVPPRDAEATAQRIADALSGGSRKEPLYFADMNAVSPSTCKGINLMFEKARVPVKFIDGCIIGDPPSLTTTVSQADDQRLNSNDAANGWRTPSLPISGPHSLSDTPDGDRIISILKMRSISPEIGAASGLKMCFAAMAKGYTALATQSFTTAHRMGVGEELKRYLSEIMPTQLTRIERGVPNMPPKAYRWVREMEEISSTMSEEGGWDKTIFEGIAGVYKAVAEDAVLGKEKIGKRTRGTTVDDVAALMAESLERKRKKLV